MSSTIDEAPFHHFSAKQKAIAYISSRVFDRLTYRARHGLSRGYRRRGGLGWLPQALSRETTEERFLRTIEIEGKVVYDVGAFHGLLTLFFSGRASHVVAFEPNPQNRNRLMENIRLNRLANVCIAPIALSSSSGKGTMIWNDLTPGAATIRVGGGDIPISTIDEQVALGLPVPDFIKIDTEGLEADVLRGASATIASRHPQIILEVHGRSLREKRDNAAEIFAILHSFGYPSITHVETGATLFD